MTLKEILSKYKSLRANARNYDDWKELNQFIKEIAQLAAGEPILPGEQEEDPEPPRRWY